MSEPATVATTLPDPIPVRPWPDPIIDMIGHDPRSLYVETFWLPTLGPTAVVLLRHLARRFETQLMAGDPDTRIEMTVGATSQALGLGPRDGSSAPLRRTLERLGQFDLVVGDNDGGLAVRRYLPPVRRRHVRRLPGELQAMHAEWQRRADAPRQISERRARQVSLTMAELGAGVDEIEPVLGHLGFPPLVCREAASWAHARHRADGRGIELDRASLAP